MNLRRWWTRRQPTDDDRPTVKVLYGTPADETEPAMVNANQAVLEWAGMREVNGQEVPVWTLWHVEPQVARVFLIGDLDHIDSMVTAAEEHLATVGDRHYRLTDA